MKRKILIVSEYFYPEEFKINEVALEWIKQGYQVDVLTQIPTYPSGKILDQYSNTWWMKETYEGIKIYRVKAIQGYRESLIKKILKYFTFAIYGSVAALFIRKKYDYIFGYQVGPLTAMLPAILIKKMYKKPLTIWIQDIWPDSVYAYGFKKTKLLSFFLDTFVKFVYRNSSNFAISGQGFRDRIKPYIESDKVIEYLPNWTDPLDKNLSPFKFSDDVKIHFTFTGNIGKVQNLDMIIKAFGDLPNHYKKKMQLNIIGDGSYLENLQHLVLSANIENVVFWGKRPRTKIYEYFSASDFLIVSLVDEPIFALTVPAKVQTYIAAGKPIMAVITGDAAAIVRDNNLGYTCPPNDLSAITNTFIQCADTDAQRISEFSQNCAYLTDTIFNKEKTLNSLLHLMTK